MSTLFSGTTNGGANRVFIQNDDLKISGQGVGGRPSLDASLIASVWGGTLTETAMLKAGSEANDLNDATISVAQTGGAGFVIDQLAAIGVSTFNFAPSQNQTPGVSESLVESRLTDIARALDGARVLQDADGGWELRFSGGGVGGALNTNADFATQQDAEGFLQNLIDGLEKGDTWSVIVEDDDLDGRFVFDFDKSWYQDVNAGAIETRLANSDIVNDGKIDSRAEGAAANLALFLEQMAESGDDFVFMELAKANTNAGNFGPSQDRTSGMTAAQIDAAITDLDVVLARATIQQDDDGFYELRMSGQGVSGALNTNADFKSEAAAQAFLDMLVQGSGGFLDDALL